MSGVLEIIPGDPATRLLAIVDHASNAVPDDIDLGIAPTLLDLHIAIDIGAAPLARALCARLGCPAILATVSRLAIDLHREQDSPGLIPATSDGHRIPGNESLSDAERARRIARFWTPYHSAIDALIAADAPDFLFTVHSFTPRLETRPDEDRPWQVGILYNNHDAAARMAIDLLRAAGVATGDNQPYSGAALNATMDRHAESRHLPYLAIEVRNDLIGDAAGVAHWADILAPIILECRNSLA